MNFARLLTVTVWGILACAANSTAAAGETAPAAEGAPAGSADAAPPLSAEPMVDQSLRAGDGDACDCPSGCCPSWFGPSCCSPQWTAAAEFMILERVGGASESLVSSYPPHIPLVPGTGVERLNSNDLDQGFAGGPRLSLVRHGDGDYDLELSYFQIHGWSSAVTVEPNYVPGGPPPNWLVFTAPGGFLQLTDSPTQCMAWSYATKLDNAELNVRWNARRNLTMLAGFRWVNLRENLLGTLTPLSFAGEPPFWNTTTTNNLYGFQIGADGTIFARGRFSVGGLIKAGIFDNNADESTGVSTIKVVRPSYASTNHAAFLGETGLQCRYQVAERLTLKAGYEALWLEGIAAAPGQIQETYLTSPTTVQAVGVNCNSGAFFHGATAGLTYAF